MIYPSNFEAKIEFSAVREMLCRHCLSPLGVEKVHEMRFSVDHGWICTQLRRAAEFQDVLLQGDFPEDNFHDVRNVLKRIRIENTFAEEKELLAIRQSLATIGRIVDYFGRSQQANAANAATVLYPALHELADGIRAFGSLVKQIGRVIDDTGAVRDSASAELAKIRREKALVEMRASSLLNSILSRAQKDGVVESDAMPTIRNNRLVIPVNAAMKRKMDGIVYDESSSGRTVYIEPASVVEANNRILSLERKERQEVVRILRAVSAEIRPDVGDLLANYDFLAEVDFIRSKAKFAMEVGACSPTVHDRPAIGWTHAVHPLLKLSMEQHRAGGQGVVPFDISLRAPDCRILLVSGPNAGGKSVCLKAVGLLQYMLQCGVPVPVGEDSVCGIFKDVFLDIGDEQSLENELSTYSSHLLNMSATLRHAGRDSLILIDEFGSGTEPQIGGAIAEALLKRFNAQGAFGVITTHFQNLKHFAQQARGIVNGAMLYDDKNMAPLYQLRIGHSGSSYAIEIARKIGLPEDIIQDASAIVGTDYVNIDRYLQDIVRDKRHWENKCQQIEQREKRVEQIEQAYEANVQELKEKRRQILDKAKEQAQQLLDGANAAIEKTIKDIKEAQAERERTKTARKALEDFARGMEADLAKGGAVAGHLARAPKKQKAKSRPTPHKETWEEGDFVRLKGQTVVGRILRINGNDASVAFGDLHTTVKTKQLERADAPKVEKKAATFVGRQTQDNIRDVSLNFKSSIDVRGMRAEEAIQAMTYFLDDAQVASASRVRVLHGTGTGVLRTVIREYLSSLPYVSNYHDEHPQFGGTGITVIELS